MELKNIGKSLLISAFLVVGVAPVAPVAHAGDSPNYCHDEATNPRGPNQCSSHAECDGARTCSSAGWCQGTSRADHVQQCTSGRTGWMVNTDRPDGDIDSSYLPNPIASITLCEQACVDNASCDAWTFAKGQCFLKRGTPAPIQNTLHVSGVVQR